MLALMKQKQGAAIGKVAVASAPTEDNEEPDAANEQNASEDAKQQAAPSAAADMPEDATAAEPEETEVSTLADLVDEVVESEALSITTSKIKGPFWFEMPDAKLVKSQGGGRRASTVQLGQAQGAAKVAGGTFLDGNTLIGLRDELILLRQDNVKLKERLQELDAEYEKLAETQGDYMMSSEVENPKPPSKPIPKAPPPAAAPAKKAGGGRSARSARGNRSVRAEQKDPSMSKKAATAEKKPEKTLAFAGDEDGSFTRNKMSKWAGARAIFAKGMIGSMAAARRERSRAESGTQQDQSSNINECPSANVPTSPESERAKQSANVNAKARRGSVSFRNDPAGMIVTRDEMLGIHSQLNERVEKSILKSNDEDQGWFGLPQSWGWFAPAAAPAAAPEPQPEPEPSATAAEKPRTSTPPAPRPKPRPVDADDELLML